MIPLSGVFALCISTTVARMGVHGSEQVHRVMSPVGTLRYPLVIGRVWVFERSGRSCEYSHVSFSMALCLTSSGGRMTG
jgi:hypothetical protein